MGDIMQAFWVLEAERDALRKRVEGLERSITDHHAAHVMRRQPGDVCPVCSPAVPLPQKYGDEVPKSLDLADLCQAAVARAEKAEQSEEFAIERAEKAERELSETRLEWARSVDASAAMRKGLQADLDAVLNTVEWLMSLADVPLGAGGRSGDRTRALLENRRQKRG